jgi:hypothetical protein
MSQAGIVDIEGSHPQIPTAFVANVGIAIPIANTIEILGAAVAAHGVPVQTVASGNTLTVDVQHASAAASSVAANAGIASFNSSQFTVDGNGFVTFTGTGAAETLTGNSGGAVSPTGSNINTVGTGSITIVGNPGTSTLATQLTGLTNHNVLVGAGTATITNVPPSTAGFVLTSNGASTDPSFQAAAVSGIVTIDGDSGSVTGTTIHLLAHTGSANAGSSVSFTAASATEMDLVVSDPSNNTLIGTSAGNPTITGTDNVGLGADVLHAVTSGIGNIAQGSISLQNVTSGQYNVGIGNATLAAVTTNSYNTAVGGSALTITTGSQNTSIGGASLGFLTSGSSNIAIGYNAGEDYTSSESGNIVIGNVGVLGESDVIRIGQQSIQTECFIAGITGVTVSNTEYVTINSSTGQLGVAAIPSAFAWSDKATSFAAVSGNGYFITGTATATLPASPSEGNTISFIVDTTNILTIQANTGQIIRIGTAVSASAGTATNNARGDSVTLVFRSSNSAWISLGAPQGTWTVT